MNSGYGSRNSLLGMLTLTAFARVTYHHQSMPSRGSKYIISYEDMIVEARSKAPMAACHQESWYREYGWPLRCCPKLGYLSVVVARDMPRTTLR